MRVQDPNQINWDKPQHSLKGSEILLESPFQPRTFWGLISSKGDTMIVSEREIVLDKAINFRDLGGLETAEGKRVKWACSSGRENWMV